MQTPLDRFHYALQSLAAQKAAAEARAARPPRDQMARGYAGERVVFKPATPTAAKEESGVHGIVLDEYRGSLQVQLDAGLGLLEAHQIHFIQERPLPTFTNTEDVDAWLMS